MTGECVITPMGDGACDAQAPVLTGFSGGLDSTVLLHLLAKAPGGRARGLRALHVHHGLHADADAWALHCERQCAALDVPFEVVRVAVRRDGGEGLEAAARDARHAAFASTLRTGEVLALAHHLDDQAETFLMRALRASGDGLGAMRPWRAFVSGHLWRPLLDTPRADLLRYAQAHGLEWIEDPSNASEAHDRNFLRHRVMPLLRGRWPHADASLARSAALQRDAAAMLDDADAQALAGVRCVDPACLDVPKLRALPAPRRARVLRLWIAGRGLPPLPAEGVARIERNLLRDATDGTPEFGWRNAVMRRWRELLWVERRRPVLDDAFRCTWHGEGRLPLPTGDALSFGGAAIGTPPTGGWVVHARRGGERIRLPGRPHSHALKQVLQDAGVPPWLRPRLPLLSSAGGELLAVADLVVSAGFDAWMRERGIRLQWHPATQ